MSSEFAVPVFVRLKKLEMFMVESLIILLHKFCFHKVALRINLAAKSLSLVSIMIIWSDCLNCGLYVESPARNLPEKTGLDCIQLSIAQHSAMLNITEQLCNETLACCKPFVTLLFYLFVGH